MDDRLKEIIDQTEKHNRACMPAFPVVNFDCKPHIMEYGISKREYFAAKAMEGLCADRHHADTQGNPKAIAALAVEIADALVVQLDALSTGKV